MKVRNKQRLALKTRFKLVSNRKASSSAAKVNPLRTDPTRTATLRRSFSQELKKRFAILKGRILKMIGEDDALGIGERSSPLAVVSNQLAVPVVRQSTDYSCGAAAFTSVLRFYGIDADEMDVAKELDTNETDGTALQRMTLLARRMGMLGEKYDDLNLPLLRNLVEQGTPVIAGCIAHGESHWVVITEVGEDELMIVDPYVGLTSWSISDWLQRTERVGVVIKPDPTMNANPEGHNQYTVGGLKHPSEEVKSLSKDDADKLKDLTSTFANYSNASSKSISSSDDVPENEVGEYIDSRLSTTSHKVSKLLGVSHEAAIEWLHHHFTGPENHRATYNQFCPTGMGGGVDPSCGKSESKGGHSGGFSIRTSSDSSSELSPQEDYKQNGTKAKAFKEWFGDYEKDPAGSSKVVDPTTGKPQAQQSQPAGDTSVVRTPDGHPIVVYHGTSGHFDTFEKRDGEGLVFGPGHYFTEDRDIAGTFDKGGGETKAVYLNIRTPMNLDKEFTRDEYEKYTGKRFGLFQKIGQWATGKKTINGHDLYQEMAAALGSKAKANERLQELGHDGMTHTKGAYVAGKGNVKHAITLQNGRTIYPGMEHDKVWIAFESAQIKSVNNKGTFDKHDGNINNQWTVANVFCPTGPGGGVDASCSPGSSKVEQGVKDAIKATKGFSFHGLEQAAIQWVSDRCQAAVSLLPKWLQAPVTATYYVGKALTQAAFITWTAGQAFAERVMKERGLKDDEAKKLRGILSAVDLGLAKPTIIGAEVMHFGTAVALGASFVPVGTMSYLAHSTVKNPLATIRAATGVVTDTAKAVGKFLRDNTIVMRDDEHGRPISNNADAVGYAIADALRAHGYSDWYVALLSAALDVTENVADAIEVANKSHDKEPTANDWVTLKTGQHVFIADGEILGHAPHAESVNRVQQSMLKKYGWAPSEKGSFGHSATISSIAHAQASIKRGETNLEDVSAAIHRGWAETARTHKDQTDEQRERRKKLADTEYSKLSEEEKEKDRVIAREVLKEHGKYWGNKSVQPFYRPGANPTVDNIITRDGKQGKEVLLIQRSKDSPAEPGKWALPGGFHDSDSAKGEKWKSGKESAREAALRELHEETGLHPKSLAAVMKKVGTYEGNNRDPRDNEEAWSKSTAFKLHLPKGLSSKVKGGDDASKARWVPVDQLHKLSLAFDHGKILKDAGVGITNNAFCPTGKGGGQDNSCSGGKSSSPVAQMIEKAKWVYIYDGHDTRLKRIEPKTAKEAEQLDKEIKSGQMLSSFEDDHRHDKKETMLIIHDGKKNGKNWGTYPKLEIWEGTEDRIYPSGNLGGTTVTHNHPKDANFSILDVTNGIATGMKELRAFTPSGTVFSLKKTEDYYQHPLKPGETEPRRSYLPTPPTRTEISKRIGEAIRANVTMEEAKLPLDKQVGIYDKVWKDVTSQPFEFNSREGGTYHVQYSYTQTKPPTANARDWEFHSSPEKVEQFQKWLKKQFKEVLTGQQQEEMWKRYTEAGFKKGAGRAFDDVRKSKWKGKEGAFYEGTKDEFLRSSFGRPESIEKVKLLAGRSFDDLEGVTDQMSLAMSRELTDGLVEGKGPKEIARDLIVPVDSYANRALTIARTELIRAHSEGQIQSFKALGVKQLGVQVEWMTAGDDAVCPECEDLGGTIYDIDEASGLIPAHPNCRCCFTPANVGEEPTGNRLRGYYLTANQKFIQRWAIPVWNEAVDNAWIEVANAIQRDELGRFAPTDTAKEHPEKIEQTAIKSKGKVYPSGPMHTMGAVPEEDWDGDMESGFLTSHGNYLNRKEASEFVTGPMGKWRQLDATDVMVDPNDRNRSTTKLDGKKFSGNANADQPRDDHGRWSTSDSTEDRVNAWLDSRGEVKPQELVTDLPYSIHKEAATHLSSEAKQLIESSHDWEELKPWNASKEDLAAGKVKGFEAGSYSNAGHETAHYENGKIVVSDKFTGTKWEDVRRAIVYHELGHELSDSMLNDETAYKLKMPKELNGQTTPGEKLAEAYSLLHADLPYLDKNAPELIKPVVDRAVALGMPLPKEVFSRFYGRKRKVDNSYVINPAVSEAQRKYLNAEFGHDWVKEHHFDNKGKLPDKVKKKDNSEAKKHSVDNLWEPATVKPLTNVENQFCPTGPGGGIDATCGAGGKSVEPQKHPKEGLTNPPCCPSTNKPDSENARVGVSASSVPPPPMDGIPRLPNLTPDQRAVETRFVEAYLNDPDKMVDKYLKALADRKVGEYPNVFATDDVKMLNRDWNPDKVRVGQELTDDTKAAMAEYNTAVHQTANAISKRAFVKYLDEVVSKYPEGDPRRSVFATNGGCAAGKGSTVSRTNQEGDPHFGMTPAHDQVGAIWDAAGEQNSTENEWVKKECDKRGIKSIFAYVWAEPKDTWDSGSRGVIRRAMNKGRMVDARLFADSYAEGAKNMNEFAEKHKNDGTQFIFVDNRNKNKPALLSSFPKETLRWDGEEIYRHAVESLHKHKKEKDLSKQLIKGGLNGTTIWGPPSE